MGNPLYHDNLDDRKEAWRLLSHPRMDDQRRLAFVRWCARQTRDGMVENAVRTRPEGGYTPTEAWHDMLALSFQFRLDLSAALAKLVQVVRRL